MKEGFIDLEIAVPYTLNKFYSVIPPEYDEYITLELNFNKLQRYALRCTKKEYEYLGGDKFGDKWLECLREAMEKECKRFNELVIQLLLGRIKLEDMNANY